MTPHEIPAPGFSLTKGRKPRTGGDKLRAQFRNGHVDERHEYTAEQLRWTDTGHAFDVVAVQRVGADKRRDGRQANGAYE